jgi:hypothetical protein
MILEKTISISIKHETSYKDETEIPETVEEQLSEEELKKQDKKTSDIVMGVMKEVKDIMRTGEVNDE